MSKKYLLLVKTMKIYGPVLPASCSLPVKIVPLSDLPRASYCMPSDSRGGVHKKEVHS